MKHSPRLANLPRTTSSKAGRKDDLCPSDDSLGGFKRAQVSFWYYVFRLVVRTIDVNLMTGIDSFIYPRFTFQRRNRPMITITGKGFVRASTGVMALLPFALGSCTWTNPISIMYTRSE